MRCALLLLMAGGGAGAGGAGAGAALMTGGGWAITLGGWVGCAGTTAGGGGGGAGIVVTVTDGCSITASAGAVIEVTGSDAVGTGSMVLMCSTPRSTPVPDRTMLPVASATATSRPLFRHILTGWMVMIPVITGMELVFGTAANETMFAGLSAALTGSRTGGSGAVGGWDGEGGTSVRWCAECLPLYAGCGSFMQIGSLCFPPNLCLPCNSVLVMSFVLSCNYGSTWMVEMAW